ncbi:MAG TPA: redoxin domain-containing protein [Terriglobia bacterium]|nr:redoxin domain-containing protein [Terriglobia bacterium]
MALKVGDAAPDFKAARVVGEDQGEFQLSAQRGKNVVIVFYPGDFTPVCTNELQIVQSDLAKFTAANAEVVGISTDTVFSHSAFQKSLGGLSFSLATDRWPYADIAKAYGVFPPARHKLPFWNDRAIFIVDKNGNLAWSKVYEIGSVPDIDEVLQAVAALG